MIKILDTDLNRLGVIRNVIDCIRLEEINGENTLDFNAVLDSKLNSLIDETSIFEVEDQYFDTALLKKSLNDDGTYTIEVESEHVSYRLNNPLLNVESFTETGTPEYILGKILEGTGFTVGGISYLGTVTYAAQEAKSRRQLLMEFVATLNGEVYFNNFQVSIFLRRGSSTVRTVMKDRNVKIISKTVNKRTLNDDGESLVSYLCTPIYMSGEEYALGDSLKLVQPQLNINEELRVVRLTKNPYNTKDLIMSFANYTNGLESHLYRIVSSAVVKDKLYNGTRIGPEHGFEAVRSDNLARAYFRSDGMKFQSGDGSGLVWNDVLYFEYDPETDETKLVFGGLLHGGEISLGGTLEDPAFSVDSDGNAVAKSVTLQDKISILGQGNSLVIDEWGINPSYLGYPNKVINSGFEIYEIETGLPMFWTGGGYVTGLNAYEGTVSMRLAPLEYVEQGLFSTEIHSAADPDTWGTVQSRIAFRQKGGAVRIRARLLDNTPYILIDNSGEEEVSDTYIDFPEVDDWDTGLRSVYYIPIFGLGPVKIMFEAIGDAPVFIDAVQHGPDLTGRWPLPYSAGPHSIPVAVSFGEVSANDLEFRAKAVTHGLDVDRPIIR